MDEISHFRHEGIKSLYKALVDIFHCYDINSHNIDNLRTDYKNFDDEVTRAKEQGFDNFNGSIDKFDLVTCHLAIDAYNAFENRVGKTKASEIYNAVMSGSLNELRGFLEDEEC